MPAFALLADHLPFVVTRFDRARRHLFVNKAVTDMLGLSPSTLVGKTNEELGMSGDLLALWTAALDEALGGAPTSLTFEWTGPHGLRMFEAKIVPETIVDGRVETVLGITRDVTAEVLARRAEDAVAQERMRRLEDERRELAALFAESLAAVSVVRGPELSLQLLNPRAQALWGRADEILGKPLLEALPELAGQGFEQLLRDVMATGEVFRGTDVPIAIDHGGAGVLETRYFDFIYAPLRDRAGVIDGVIVHAHDVTERRHVEAALRESEARFRALADHVAQLAWMADRDGHLDWFNQRWLDYTGTRLEDNVGDGWKAAHHPDHVAAVAEKFARHLREGLDWEDTFPLRGRDGTYRWFLSRMTAIRDANGEVVRFFGTNTDVTEQRELEDDLRRLSTELAEADRRKDEFLATLAHELRNPLAPIRSGLTVLRSTPPATDGAARTFEMMERQLAHLVRLVDDLLDISRVRSGKITLTREHLSLREIVEVAIEACRPAIDARAHALVVDLRDAPLTVHGDRTRLVQVIANLVTNAAKYSERQGRIEISLAHDDTHAVIRVTDSGVGIAPEAIPTLWDMFTQVRDTLEKAQGGLGIGLSLSKRLVELHGGSITARSRGLGHGSTFEVRLPLATELARPATPTLPAAPPGPAPSPTRSTRRILVVDDNIDGAETLSMLLELGGHEVRVAHSGPTALEAVEQFSPELVFLDIGLPGMDGYEVARHVRASPVQRSVVLVALTGWGTAADQQRSRDAGFDAHLTKPIQFAVIEELLARFPHRAAP